MKKYFIFIVIAHLLVPVSLLFPVLNLQERMAGSTENVNIFRFVNDNHYVFLTVLILILLFASVLGAATALYGIFSKNENKHAPIRNSFFIGFSEAILSAIFLSSGSYIAFTICAIMFIVISVSAIRLLKLEK